MLKTAGKENVLLPFDSLCLAFDNGHRQRLMLIDSSNYAGSETSLGRIRLDSIYRPEHAIPRKGEMIFAGNNEILS